MSNDLNKWRKSALLGSAATLAASFALGVGVTSVSAQDADDEELEEVVVTGSRIVRKDLDSVSPLSVTSSADVKLSGFTKVEDLMNSLPQIEAAQTSFLSNGATGTATLDLRGMGTSRTLVLMNGRRLQPGGMSSAPDINQIPAALVKRAEVITGGASTTYGADAVAGVVNFVMNDDFEGLEITAGISGFQHNNRNDYIQGLMDERGFEYPSGSNGIGGKEYNVDMTVGGDFADGKGHATAYATWRKSSEMLEAERDYSSCALTGSGTGCGGSGNAIVPNFYIAPVDENGVMDWGNYEYLTLDPNGDGFIQSVGNVYNYAPVNHFMRPDERWTLGAFVDYEINEMFKPYLEVSFMRDRTTGQIAESGTFFAEQYNLSCDNGLLSATQMEQICGATGAGGIAIGADPANGFAVYIGKRNVEGGPRRNNITHNAFRIVTGIEGDINENWRYDASFLYGSTTFTSSYQNDFFAPRIATALDPEACAAAADFNCEPYEVFTYNGVTSRSAGNLTGTAALEGVTTEYVANAFVAGDTGFKVPMAEDNVQLVAGWEYRKEVFDMITDEVYELGMLLGQGGPTQSLGGSYELKEVFSEISIPLVQDAPMAQDITLELAARYSDYNTSGGHETYKAAVSWTPVDAIKIVASYNRAVRSPNVGEMFSPIGAGLWSGEDPCAGETPEQTAAQCANSGVTAAQYGTITFSPADQYNSRNGGNPDLGPETADTYSVGAVLSPMDDLRIRVDYWDIQLNDAIATIGAQLAVDQCGLTGADAFCSLVNRGNAGSLWLGTTGYVSGQLANIGGRHFAGIDVSTDYTTEIGEGNLTAKLMGTYMTKKEIDPIAALDGDEYGCISDYITNNCFAQPKWRHTMTVTYDSGDFWAVTGKWRYFGKVGGANDGSLDDHIKAQSYLDLKAAFTINENVNILVGVNNVLDREPPLVASGTATNANTFAGYYDTLGRKLHASVTFNF